MKWNYLKPIYTAILLAFTLYVLLDTFVIERVYEQTPDVEKAEVPAADTAGMEMTENSAADTAGVAMTDSYYKDNNIEIHFTEERILETNVYIADVTVSDMSLLKTAFADNAYGRNIKQTTSDMAAENGAILTINGDYWCKARWLCL